MRRDIASVKPLTVATGENVRPDSSLREEAANQAVVSTFCGGRQAGAWSRLIICKSCQGSRFDSAALRYFSKRVPIQAFHL